MIEQFVKRMMSTVPHDRISIAPMLNVTNEYQRYFTRLLTKKTTLYTEMFVDETLIHAKCIDDMLDFDPSEHPIVAQLGGSNKHTMLKAAKLLEQKGYDEININCGCPSPRVFCGSFGARLMLSPWRVYDIVQHLQHNISVPITVKCRIGVDDCDSYEDLYRFIHIVSGDAYRSGEVADITASDDDVGDIPTTRRVTSIFSDVKATLTRNESQFGVDHFIIHARKCLLHGLSVKENRSIPPIRYDWVYRLLDDFPQLSFTINGGVMSLGLAKQLIERHSEGGRKVEGVMIGRLLTKAPWVFHYVDQFFYDSSNPPMSRYDTIMKYVDYCEEMQCKGKFDRLSPTELLKPIFSLFAGSVGGCAYRREMQTWVSRDKRSIREAVLHAFNYIPSEELYDMRDGDIDRIDDYKASSET